MKNIIVPLDFSKESMNGFRVALLFANEINADITLVYVQIEINEFYSRADKDEYDYAKNKLDELIEKHKSKLKNGTLKYKIRKGKVSEEVVNQAKYDDSYMIIASTHGASGYEEFWIGSRANKIIAKAKCPVLTVPNSSCARNISKIILPIDRSQETRQKVPLAVQIAKFFNSEIHVLSLDSANTKESKKKLDAYTSQVSSFLKENNVKYIEDYLTGKNISEMIINYAKLQNAELIVIMTEQEIKTSNLWLGPYAQQLVNHSSIPVLSVHSENKFIPNPVQKTVIGM
ncbi:MAG: universal stress protein [Bacteroidota bacterium]|nr:universal stress protein [Bacteroidota bacterium]